MIKTIKVMLQPNKKQRTKLFECAGVARFVYNWVLDYEKLNHECDLPFVTDYELRKRLTELKKTHLKFMWLNDYSNNTAKQAVKDACIAYLNFFKGKTGFPKYKSRKKSRSSFYVDTGKISFTDTHVKLEKLTTSKRANKQKFNYVRLAEKGRILVNVKYFNPRVTYDGVHWWISVGIEVLESTVKPVNDGIGIDIGIKTLAVCSDKKEYRNINKAAKVRKLKKKMRRLQRRISKKYLKIRKEYVTVKHAIL